MGLLRACSSGLVLVLLLMAWPGAASAQRVLALAGDVGLGAFDGAMHTTVQSGITVEEGGLKIALFGRVRLVLHDTDERGYVRARDVDEVSDFVSILRTLRYARRFGSVSLRLRAGRLRGYTLGHGTIVRDYSNVSDPDHPRPGVTFELAHERFDLALMLDNFINPSLVAGRFALRPVAPLPKLVFGATLAVDARAPARVLVDADPLAPSSPGVRRVDDAFNLQADRAALVVSGVDAEYTFGRRSHGLTPYFDFNVSAHGGAGKTLGFGVHLGARAALELDKAGDARLTLRAEFVHSGPAYAPRWFQTFYDLERYQASLAVPPPTAPGPTVGPVVGAAARATRLGAVALGNGGNGAFAEIGLQLRRLSLRAGFAYEPVPDPHRIFVRASARPIDRLTLAALVVVRGVGEPGADVARGISALAEARFAITDVFYALAQYTRLWSLDATTRWFSNLSGVNLALGARWSG